MATGKRHRRRKRGRGRASQQRMQMSLVVTIAIVIVAAIYFLGAFFFMGHLYSRNSVFGISLFGKSVESVEDKIIDKVGEYTLTIVTSEGEETLTASDMDLQYYNKGKIQAMMDQQNAFAWPLFLAGEKQDLLMDVSFNDLKLSESMRKLNCFTDGNYEAPVDAHLTFDGNEYAIIPETIGNQADFGQAFTLVKSAVTNGEKEVDLVKADAYCKPLIYKDNENLVALLDKMNQMLNVTLTFDFGDREEIVDRTLIGEWLTYNDREFTHSFDEDKIMEYVETLAYNYDTLGLSRKFVTSFGNTVDLKGGDYGWLTAKEKTKNQIMEDIEAGESKRCTPVYRYEGKCRNTNDIGDSYIEVNIDAQTMWLYIDGACIISTDVVTGCVYNETETPRGGVWAIDGKMEDWTLVGEDYTSPVKWWLPFNGNVGIHDASWREDFGGNIYKGGGSHGCVNTPDWAMKTIYKNAEIGMPVVVY